MCRAHRGWRKLGLLPLLIKEARELITALIHVAARLIEGPTVVPHKAHVVCYCARACVEVAL